MSTGSELLSPRLLRLNEFEFDSKWRIAAHTHSDVHELLIVTGGRMGLRMPDGRINEERGSVLILPKNLAHEVWTIGPGPLRMYCLWWEAPATPVAARVSRQEPDAFGRIEAGIRWLKEIVARRRPGWYAAADGVLRAILHECGGDANHSHWIERAQAFARERLAEPLTLDDLAGSANVSRSHFAHEFKKSAGCSPMQYLRNVRVEAATRLLVSSVLPLKSIAELTGFRDAFELSRVIKRTTSRSPREIRHAAKLQPPVQPA